MPDYTILKQTLADAGPAADREMAYFYSLLFTANPELRAMFPLAMDEQRRALSAALARCAWSMDNPQSLHEYLAQLGRDHRKYGVQEQHYQVFGADAGHRAAAAQRAVLESRDRGRLAHGHQPRLLGDGRRRPGRGGRAAVVGRGGDPARTALPRSGRARPSGPASHLPTSPANT